MRWIDYGLSVLTRPVVAERVKPGGSEDFANVLRDLSLTGGLAGLEVSERFFEAGSTRGLRDLETYLATAGALADQDGRPQV